MSEPIRVLLVDDQDLIRTGFRLILLREPDIVVAGEATDGATALATLAQFDGACDVVLMDVRMPRMNGIDATRRIVAEHPGVRVLVLTTFDLDEYAQAAVQAGASGFLLKDCEPDRLLEAVRRIHDGESLFAPSVLTRLVAHYVAHPARGPASPPARLTPREVEVLALVGRGLSNHEIAAHLVISVKTVKTHVGSLLAKLHARDRAQLVIAAYEAGVVARDRA